MEEEKLKSFLFDLRKLYMKHGIELTSCECCQGLWATTATLGEIDIDMIHLFARNASDAAERHLMENDFTMEADDNELTFYYKET